ncbi:MAG: hypothetical protein AAFY41_18590, partial [Bacteroidota bacterium]
MIFFIIPKSKLGWFVYSWKVGKQWINDALKKGELGIVWMDDASNRWLKTRLIKAQTVSLRANQQTAELEKKRSSTGYKDQIMFQKNVIGHLHGVGLGKVMLPLLSA